MTEPQASACALAVAHTARLSPKRLARLLSSAPAADVWREVGPPGVDPCRLAAEYRKAGVDVHVLGQPGYPDGLAADPEAPAVLFSRGSLDALKAPRVCIIGTRRCTHYGRDVAHRLGRELASAGVAVVSGLALGIDGAAHSGALSAGAIPVIGVVGSGLDTVYPARHAALWKAVAERGLLLSEAPLGAVPEPWRFPERNRILAALADAVVVVESHAAGGSNHTVAAAIARGVPVLAVPGPVTSSASAGTNRLLAEGCAPVAEAADVLVALGLERGSTAAVADRRPPPAGTASAVLAAVDWSPTSLDTVLRRTGLSLPEAATALTRLEGDGWVRADGGWWQRVAAPP